MADTSIQGVDDCLKKLSELGDPKGKFSKQSLRRALREEAKTLRGYMLSVIPAETGLTRVAVKYKTIRSRKGFFMGVGVFGLARKGPLSTFFAGFANYGHNKAPRHGPLIGVDAKATPVGGRVQGIEWTEKVKATMGGSAQAIGETLAQEVATIVRGT